MSSDPETATDISQDLVFDLLSSHRRRMVLYYLKQRGEPVTVREISEAIASMENEVPIEELTRQQQKRVYVSLYQTHLPKLSQAGVINYDREAGKVQLTDAGSGMDQYLQPDSQRGYPWALHYLVLGVLGLALFLVSLLPTPGPIQVTPLAVGVLLTIVLGTSAIVHYWSIRRSSVELFDERLEDAE